MKIPKKVGEAVDLAYQLREKRLAYQREVEEKISLMKEDEIELEEYILRTFKQGELEKGGGKLCTASISRVSLPVVKDWPKVWEYVAEHDAWDLLQKRITTVAWRDRLETEPVPGVETFVKVSLTLTKK